MKTIKHDRMRKSDESQAKKVLSILEGELDKKKDALTQAIERLIPKGKTVRVLRGQSIWEVVSEGAATSNYYIGCFRGRTRTGKIHFFNYRQIIP